MPTKKYMIHKVKDDDLLKNLREKNLLVNTGRELTKKISDLENDRDKIGLQIQKLKDKIIPVGEELIKPVLGEFDMLITIQPELDKDGRETGMIDLEYIDQVEDFKEALRDKMKEGKTLGEVAAEANKEAEEMGIKYNTDSNENTTN